jgi:hypothetical protein
LGEQLELALAEVMDAKVSGSAAAEDAAWRRFIGLAAAIEQCPVTTPRAAQVKIRLAHHWMRFALQTPGDRECLKHAGKLAIAAAKAVERVTVIAKAA